MGYPVATASWGRIDVAKLPSRPVSAAIDQPELQSLVVLVLITATRVPRLIASERAMLIASTRSLALVEVLVLRIRSRNDGTASATPFVAEVGRAVDEIGRHALLLGQFAQAVGIGTVVGADHEHEIALLAQLAHGVLAVLRGVADIGVARPQDGGEMLAQGLDHGLGVVLRQGGRGH